MRTLKCWSKRNWKRSLDLKAASYDIEEIHLYKTQIPVFPFFFFFKYLSLPNLAPVQLEGNLSFLWPVSHHSKGKWVYGLPRFDLYIQLYPVYTVRIMSLEHIFVPESQLGWFSCWCEDTPPWAACVGRGHRSGSTLPPPGCPPGIWGGWWEWGGRGEDRWVVLVAREMPWAWGLAPLPLCEAQTESSRGHLRNWRCWRCCLPQEGELLKMEFPGCFVDSHWEVECCCTFRCPMYYKA